MSVYKQGRAPEDSINKNVAN